MTPPASEYKPGFLEAVSDTWNSASGKALILANLTPVLGLLFFHWTIFSVVFLYWFENIVIGVFQVAKMAIAGGGSLPVSLTFQKEGAPPEALSATLGPLQNLLKVFMIPFFCVHYGVFTYVHGIFVMAFFGNGAPGFHGRAAFHIPPDVGFAATALVASHAYLFVKDYWLGGEFRAALVPQLMTEPYGRVVALHVFILASAFLVAILRLSPNVLVGVVAGKILWDCWQDARRPGKVRPSLFPVPAA